MGKRRIVQSVLREDALGGGRRITLVYRTEGLEVPGILLLPQTEAPSPAVLLLHGYSSRKEVMAEGVGETLLRRGIASLAIDLPLHGTRADPVEAQAARNPLAVMRLFKLAIREARVGLRYLEARPEVDSACIGVAGYSMGSMLGVLVAAEEPNVAAVVVAAGGDLPSGTPLATIARLAADPARAVRRLRGRPLLLVHGTRDRTVLPEQAQRLFDAAGEPKEIRWWDAGHILPPLAIAYAAEWLSVRLGRRGGAAASGRSRGEAEGVVSAHRRPLSHKRRGVTRRRGRGKAPRFRPGVRCSSRGGLRVIVTANHVRAARRGRSVLAETE